MLRIILSKKSSIIHKINGITAIFFIASIGSFNMAVAAGLPHIISQTDKIDPSTVTFKEASKAWRDEGIFPNLESIAKMQTGLTKQEVYTAFGKPHFSEGFFAVRQWDYIFKFNVGNASGGGNDGKGVKAVEICQYQIHYTQNFTVSNTFWNRPECAAYALDNRLTTVVSEPKIVEKVVEVDRVVEKVVEKQIATNRLSLQGDALFAFGKSNINDMLPGGHAQLAMLAKSIKAGIKSIESIQITGHTDRLGSEEINASLSLARANTVRDALVMHGVVASTFKTLGMGAANPVKSCSGSQSAALIACLQDNRRVEIEVTGISGVVTTNAQKSAELTSPEKNRFAQPEKIVHNLTAPENIVQLKWAPILVRVEP